MAERLPRECQKPELSLHTFDLLKLITVFSNGKPVINSMILVCRPLNPSSLCPFCLINLLDLTIKSQKVNEIERSVFK